MQHVTYLTRHYKRRRLTDFYRSKIFRDIWELTWYQFTNSRDEVCASKSNNLSNCLSCPLNKNIYKYFIHWWGIPSSSFTVFFSSAFGKRQRLDGFKFCLLFLFFFFAFLASKEFFPTPTHPPGEHHPKCPSQLDPFKPNVFQLLVLWLNPLVRQRAKTAPLW